MRVASNYFPGDSGLIDPGTGKSFELSGFGNIVAFDRRVHLCNGCLLTVDN